jgi:hypothetical protein
MEYSAFLDSKRQLGGNYGFKPEFVPDYLFDFQKALLDYAVNKGRSAIFADCGMGKTPLQLCWAQNVVQQTNGNVLILAPLAVSQQTIHEADKFGVECHRSRDGQPKGKITITNYEKLHLFNANDFVGVVCDESSILKNYKGSTKQEITAFMRKLPYRLLATATPSPNDFIELGTSSEALGYLGSMDMMNKFFKNDQNNSKVGQHRGQQVKWRLKGHAELPFWRWVCSWARAIRRPSDIGFSDEGFVLPELVTRETVVEARQLAEGMLFAMPAMNLFEQREERRRTIGERCEVAASKVNHTGEPAIVWCHMNDEGDLLEKMIPDCVQVSGKDSDEKKEDKIMAFQRGDSRVLVVKPVIGAWGMNFQHCNHMTVFPSHSFEQYYQLIRRCWRFGQKRPVTVDIITTEGEGRVMKNLLRKAEQADAMFDNLVHEMNNALSVSGEKHFNKKEEIPSWL